MVDAFTGEIRMFGGQRVPAGWALCDGQSLLISEYEQLYALILNQWGGDGQTTFAVPDLRNRVAVGQGQGPGLTLRKVSEVGGTDGVALQPAELPAHRHAPQATRQLADTQTISAVAGFATTASTSAGSLVHYADPTAATAPVVVALDAKSIRTAGAAAPAPHTNLMPYLAVNYIICLQGIYPSQG